MLSCAGPRREIMSTADTHSTPQSRRDQRIVDWFSKSRLLATFWLAQALVLYTGGAAWQVLAETADPRGHEFGTLSPVRMGRMLTRPEYVLGCTLAIGILMLMQWLLLAPVRKPRARHEHGRPLWLSMTAAGAGVAALAAALLYAAIEGAKRAGLGPPELPPEIGASWVPLAAWCLVCWAIATPLLVAFCRKRLRQGSRWEEVLGVVSARLFMGTIIEVAAIMPLDVLVRRRENCYCWAGTFIALTACGALGLALVGPVILLPALARRRKRWYGGHCDCCGYDMTGLLSRSGIDRCPECGAGWKSERTEPAATEGAAGL